MRNTTLICFVMSLLASAAGAQTVPATGPQTPPALPAPPRGTSRLEGTVTDAATGKPVAFATVALLPAGNGAPLDGDVCDERGQFKLKGLAVGAVRLQVSFIGYATRTLPVTLEPGLNTGPVVALTAAAQKLGEVTVTGERPLVESTPDRLIYNADKDLTNAGGTAADVLRKVPLVSVDPEGNVELRGTGNVRVLINNKPSGILAASVADALKQLPADQIQRVEVITVPSAKYDAEGTGGIINIILKKNTLEGLNGSAGLAGGTRSSNANAALSYRRGKLGLGSSVSSLLYYSPNRSDLLRSQPTAAGGFVPTLAQEGSGSTLGGSGFGRVSLDYDPALYHNLTLSVLGSLAGSHGVSSLYNLRTPGAPLGGLAPGSTEFIRDADRTVSTRSLDLSGSYTRTFAQKRQEWSTLAQHTRSFTTQGYDLGQYTDQGGGLIRDNGVDYREHSRNQARNLETTLQTDYTQPFSETSTLEVGAKLILRRVGSAYAVALDPLGSGPLVPNAPRSNDFAYVQDVLAAYLTYGFNLTPKLSTRLGLRTEHTRLAGQFAQQYPGGGEVAQQYTSVLPNLSVSYQPGNSRQPGQTLRLAYARRIQRPLLYYLNPFVNAADSLNISYGNPQLRPELTDSYELTYTTLVKGAALNASAYARHTVNAIETYRFLDTEGVNNQTYRNIGRNAVVGLSLYGSVKPVPQWDLGGTVNLYFVSLASPALGLTRTGLLYSLSVNSGYKLGHGLSFQFFGSFNSPRVQLQGTQATWAFYSLGLRKNLFKDKADLTLNADNFLTATRDLRTELTTDQFNQVSNNYVYLRGVRVAFGFRFGKVSAQPAKRSRRIQNDDAKQSDSGQSQP